MYVRPYDPAVQRQEIPWCRVRLNADQLDDRQLERLRGTFTRAYLAADRPKGMSLWLLRLGAGRADLFFSPACVASEPHLIDRYNGNRCFAPKRAAQLLAGNDHGLMSRTLWQHQLPRSTRARVQLPATYRCRTVYKLEDHGGYPRHELTPFVRRYIDAWFSGARGPVG